MDAGTRGNYLSETKMNCGQTTRDTSSKYEFQTYLLHCINTNISILHCINTIDTFFINSSIVIAALDAGTRWNYLSENKMDCGQITRDASSKFEIETSLLLFCYTIDTFFNCNFKFRYPSSKSKTLCEVSQSHCHSHPLKCGKDIVRRLNR